MKIIGELKPNGPGTGIEYIHGAEVVIDFSKNKNVNPEKLEIIADKIYKAMQKFEGFNNKIANVVFIEHENGKFYAGFETLGATGYLATYVSGDGLENRAYVEITYEIEFRRIKARTLGNHMLVGTRAWGVDIVDQNKIKIWTNATEKRSRMVTDIGFTAPHPEFSPGTAFHGGEAMTILIWDAYLNNVANAHANGGEIIKMPGISRFVGQRGFHGYR